MKVSVDIVCGSNSSSSLAEALKIWDAPASDAGSCPSGDTPGGLDLPWIESTEVDVLFCLGDGRVPPDVWRHTDTSSMILWTIFMVPHFAGIWCYIGQHTELVSSCERLEPPKMGTKTHLNQH
eukprot:s55_g7.t1